MEDEKFEINETNEIAAETANEPAEVRADILDEADGVIVEEEADEVIVRRTGLRLQDHLVLNEKDGVVYLTFPKMEEAGAELVHAFSTRVGGVSTGYLGTMNLSLSSERTFQETITAVSGLKETDPESTFLTNHRRLADAIGYRSDQLVFTAQTHTANVRRVGKADCGNGILRPNAFHDVDGLMTDERGVALMTFCADCLPLLLYDPEHHAIAACHSGRAGTMLDIGGAAVRAMHEAYGSRPEALITAIGPSICPACYEVGADVAEEFRSHWNGTDSEKAEVCTADESGKFHLDLQRAAQLNFLHAGVTEEHTSLPDLCTSCNPAFLFSHRASHGQRGSLAGVIMLRGEDGDDSGI